MTSFLEGVISDLAESTTCDGFKEIGNADRHGSRVITWGMNEGRFQRVVELAFTPYVEEVGNDMKVVVEVRVGATNDKHYFREDTPEFRRVFLEELLCKAEATIKKAVKDAASRAKQIQDYDLVESYQLRSDNSNQSV